MVTLDDDNESDDNETCPTQSQRECSMWLSTATSSSAAAATGWDETTHRHQRHLDIDPGTSHSKLL